MISKNAYIATRFGTLGMMPSLTVVDGHISDG